MYCEADEHQPGLEESKQNTTRQKLELLLHKNNPLIMSGPQSLHLYLLAEEF